ncbi:transcobalamin-1-like [Eublepharis macularius]|uniref:Transcobalamin-1-like n=1 Tax=Eublepharis macularius TaxID=481883 RepID=A0AA97IXU1_EUBMA|nr:transcobalamin-1-like [Eublepharis macularius]
MMKAVLGFLFLLLSQRQCCLGCAVSEEQRPQVAYLLNKMIQSATAPEALPNPSVLLALQLAREHNNSTNQILLQRIAQDAVDRVQNGKSFSSGQVALYALAHQASCSDPRKVSAKGTSLDLVQLLEKKFEMELENIKIYGNPLSNYYQLGLCVLTLCQLQGSFSLSKTADLFIPEQKKYYLGGQFSVDIASIAVLAQICIQSTDNSTLPEANGTITANIQWLLNKILEQKSSDGVIGNMYSTGEAIQALSVANEYLTPESWNCRQTLDRVVSEIPKGTFDHPMAAAQLLPSLEDRTYLDVSTINCSIGKDDLILIALPTIPSTNHHQSSRLITIMYTVTDGVSNTFTDSTSVSVPEGSVLFKVMEVAQEKDPKRFRFTYVNSTWGPYITSVRGLVADNNKRTYWQLLSGETPLSKGAGEYIVSDGESMVVKFTTY